MNTVTAKSFVRGVVATASVMSQPKGSIPRGSNLLLTKRGSLRTVDGSQLIHAYQGSLASGRGKVMASFLFNPVNVPNYYLALIKGLDQHLGAPQNLAVTTAAGGSLPAATYFYKVTAIDGAGGETLASSEVSQVTPLNNKNTLTWNVVPNTIRYNVYRSTSSGAEVLLGSASLPVPQPTYGTISASFVDDGTTYIVSFSVVSVYVNAANPIHDAAFTVATPAGGVSPNIIGSTLVYSGGAPAGAGGNWSIGGIISANSQQTVIYAVPSGFLPTAGNYTGGTLGGVFPSADTTQQTALFKMPVIAGSPAVLPVSYSNSNIVALFPADLSLGEGGGGGSGGGGGTGGGGSTSQGSPNGGVQGNVSLIPQMAEFSNQVVIALGNGYPPQVYNDPTPATSNPATVSNISSISVDAFGVVTVTVTGGHGFPTTGVVNVGSNALIGGVAPAVYNGAFPVIQIVSATQFKVTNLAAIGAGAGSGGTVTTTTIPVVSNFTPAIPNWSATTVYAVNAIVQPSPANSHFYKAIQAGTSGGAQPAFPTGTGQRIVDGSVLWQEAGLVNSTAPPPPGAAHIAVYSGALWVWNTSPTNTINGLDGPCCLRMSDVNNLNSWNPINQLFIDKDDGTEGMGISAFTITAQGIPPQGSLVPFKNFSTYQIIGIFGASDFALRRVKTDLGSTAPRSIQYVPGFGIMHFSHLGVAAFDGVDDRVVSEEVRPYLFPSNDADVSDIMAVDAAWVAVSWAAQTANPPMYVLAAPIGSSGGQLTRLFCYDLVLKAWNIIDLASPISTLSQFRTVSANPVTVMGGFSDGMLARIQSGDVQWDTGATGARTPSRVSWSLETSTLASNDLDQALHIIRLQIRGINTNSTVGLTVTIELDGVILPAYVSPVLPIGDFEIEVAVEQTVLRAEAVIAGSGDVELFGWSWSTVPKPAGVPLVVA